MGEQCKKIGVKSCYLSRPYESQGQGEWASTVLPALKASEEFVIPGNRAAIADIQRN